MSTLHPRATTPFGARSRSGTPAPHNHATSASISISAEKEYPFASHLLSSQDSPRSALYANLRQSSLSKERPQYKGSYVPTEESNTTANVLKKQQRNALLSHQQKHIASSYSHPSSLANSRNYAIGSTGPSWRQSTLWPTLEGDYYMDHRSYRAVSPSPSRLSMRADRLGRDPSKFYPTPQHDVIPSDRAFNTYSSSPTRSVTGVVPRSFYNPSRGGGRLGTVGTRGPSHLSSGSIVKDHQRNYSSMDYNNVPLVTHDDEIDSDEYAEDAYDSDRDVPRIDPSGSRVLLTPSPGPIRRFPQMRAMATDSGYGGVAGTFTPSSPPDHDDQPSASYLTASPLMDMNEEERKQSQYTPPPRPPPARELLRGTLLPRTPANPYFRSSLQTEVIPPAPPSPPSTTGSSESGLGVHVRLREPTLNMPGLDIREKDNPFKEIILENEEQRGRPKHSKKTGHSSRKIGGNSKGRSDNQKGAGTEVVGIREKSTVDVYRDSVIRPSSPARMSSIGRTGTGISIVGEDGSYIPSHHGRNRPLRPGAEPFSHDDYTPTCTDGLRRSWQSFKIGLRFGIFRARKRLKRSVGLS